MFSRPALKKQQQQTITSEMNRVYIRIKLIKFYTTRFIHIEIQFDITVIEFEI